MDRQLHQSLKNATASLLRQGKVEDLLNLSLDYIFTMLSQHSDRLDNLEQSQQRLKVHMNQHVTNLKQDIHEVVSRFEPALASRCEEIHIFYEEAAKERAAIVTQSAVDRHEALSNAGQDVSDMDAANIDNTMSLELAIRKGQLRIVKHLLTENGDDMECNHGNSPLIIAAKSGHLDILQYLLFNSSVDYEATNLFGNNALSVAAYMGHTEAVRLLWTTTGTLIESPDVRGCTPLLVASGSGHVEVVRQLLDEASANSEATSNDGSGILTVASASGHLEVVKYLVTQVGADTRRTTNDGKTPLLAAASYGQLQVLKYLLREREASIDDRCSRGGDCLHHAAAGGRLKLIQYLRSKTGVDILAVDLEGLDPCHWASAALSRSIRELKSGRGGVSQAKVDKLKKTLEFLKTWRDEQVSR